MNLHRHSTYSLYDGFGSPQDGAVYAAKIGQNALGITDHGSVSGVIEHYEACREAGINPIVGVEAYFQPKFIEGKPMFHMCLFAQNKEGYMNMMQMISKAYKYKFYRTGVIDFDLLEEYNQGIIATSACISGIIPKLILAGKNKLANKVTKRFKDIFDDRFFIEIMPYSKVPGQREVNENIIKIAKSNKIRAIITCDSHYVSPYDYSSYEMGFKISEKELPGDYSERYMPTEAEMLARFEDMHGEDGSEYIENTQLLADMCDVEIEFEERVPKLDWGMPANKKIVQLAVKGLKDRGIWTKEHKEQLKHELKIILDKGFEDYFLLCYDVMEFARKKDIALGFGRGSVCGSLLAYALGITEVDPLVLGTSFERFLRPDKTELPDIDIDFGHEGRQMVVDYVLEKFEGKAIPITTFGYYKQRNLFNLFAKYYGIDDEEKAIVAKALTEVIGPHTAAKSSITSKDLLGNKILREFNWKHKGFVDHFSKLYGQAIYIGRHAAGIALAPDDITKYCACIRIRGEHQTAFDLDSLEKIGIVKLDVLGLASAQVIQDVNKMTGEEFDYDMLDDEDVLQDFRDAKTTGIFQFESQTAKGVLSEIQPDSIKDIIAATALNRPAPLQLGVVQEFVRGKNGDVDKTVPWYDYTKETYGCLVFQEDVMEICRHLAKLDWSEIDRILKILKRAGKEQDKEIEEHFIKGLCENTGASEDDARELFNKMTRYLFNRGHGAGYSLMSYYQMWLKHYYPLEYYYALLKHEHKDEKRSEYKSAAVADGVIVLLPHVNGSADYEITEFEGERVIQEGLKAIKGIGYKTALEIEKHKPYIDLPDFKDKLPKRVASTRVIKALKDAGALEFTEEIYMRRTVRYNSALYARAAML